MKNVRNREKGTGTIEKKRNRFYLKMRIGGKTRTTLLLGQDDKPVTTRKDAEKAAALLRPVYMAKEETIILIQRVLDGDSSITAQEKEQILKACRNRERRKVISAKEAMRILGISRPTLRAYVHQGLLTQINVSARKVRFAQDEVE